MLSRVKFGIADQWPHPSRIELPGVVRTLDYDPLQRPTHIQVQAIGPGPAETPTGPIHLDWRLAYDLAGNLIQRDTRDGPTSYAYDPLDRLIEVVPPASVPELPLEGYQYDGVGNRTQSLHQPGAWGYDPDHRLTQYGEGATLTALTHSPNGQRSEVITPNHRTRYHYDAADRLTRIEIDGQEQARYQYDPFGRRIAKTLHGFTTWYLYADEGLIAELDATGSLSRAYGWEPDSAYGTKPLWQAEIQGSNWQFHFLHPDHLGTPQLATDAQGNISWQARSEAFGRTFPAPSNSITMNLRFPGQYYDQESGLHYNYYRDYDPETGRYIERDPIGVDGGPNVYPYVFENPLRFVDSTGLCSCIATTVKAKDDKYEPHWWGQRRIVTCTYFCKHQGNGFAEYVEATHEETYYFRYEGDDSGNEGDCLGAHFEETYMVGWNTGKFVKRRTEYREFDPRKSDENGHLSPYLRDWAELSCWDGCKK